MLAPDPFAPPQEPARDSSAGRRGSRRAFLGAAVGLPLAGFAAWKASESWAGVGSGSTIADSHESARSWFDHHRGQYAEVLARIRAGELGAPDTWEYYGPRLPRDRRKLSVTGRVSLQVGAERQSSVKVSAFFFPTWTGIPDDAVGIAWLNAVPTPKTEFDGYGMLVYPHLDLGDGWWYLDNGQD